MSELLADSQPWTVPANWVLLRAQSCPMKCPQAVIHLLSHALLSSTSCASCKRVMSNTICQLSAPPDLLLQGGHGRLLMRCCWRSSTRSGRQRCAAAAPQRKALPAVAVAGGAAALSSRRPPIGTWRRQRPTWRWRSWVACRLRRRWQVQMCRHPAQTHCHQKLWQPADQRSQCRRRWAPRRPGSGRCASSGCWAALLSYAGSLRRPRRPSKPAVSCWRAAAPHPSPQQKPAHPASSRHQQVVQPVSHRS